MPLQPEFMLKFEAFDADRRSVQTLDEWLAFQRKWFDQSQWPTKSLEQMGAETMRKRGPPFVWVDDRGVARAMYTI
jgi:hypothetical protein